jgi:hypothetical protein
VELKATRKNASSLITLFTFNRGVWQLSQKEIIESYGYIDADKRKSLYNTVYIGQENTQGLTLYIEHANNQVRLIHKPTEKTIACWSVFTIVGKFISKLERAIFVLADTRFDENKKEEFHFNKRKQLL